MQSAHETTLSATLTALAGANIIYGLGMLELGITFDYSKLIMDNEFAAMIKHAIKGIEVNEDTIALDAIREVGAGGEFVSNAHTFQNFKDVQSRGILIDRSMPEDWEAKGAKNLQIKANEVALELFDHYRPKQLDASVKKALRDIVNSAENDYGVDLSAE